jgi:hypothetical protein
MGLGEKMEHPVFGKIAFNKFFWEKEYVLDIYGQKTRGLLRIDGEFDAVINDLLIAAFKSFEENKNELVVLIEHAIFNYYNEVIEEYRDRYGEQANDYAPYIDNSDAMKKIVWFESIVLPYSSYYGNNLIVGILFKTSWEIEHGIAVKIVNGKISEVGYQDIVL